MPRHPPCALNCLFYMACTTLLGCAQGTYSIAWAITLVGCRCTTTYSYPRRMLSVFVLQRTLQTYYMSWQSIDCRSLYIVILFHHVKEPAGRGPVVLVRSALPGYPGPVAQASCLTPPLRPRKTPAATNILSIKLCDFRGYAPAQSYHHILLQYIYFNFSGATGIRTLDLRAASATL